MSDNEIDLQSYDEGLRCRDQEIAAMNRDYRNALDFWVVNHQ